MVSCNVIGKFEVNAKTLFSVTSLPGKYSPLLGVTRMVPGRQQGDSRAVVVDQLYGTLVSPIFCANGLP